MLRIDAPDQEVAIQFALNKGSFVRIDAVRCALHKGPLCGLFRSLLGFVPMSVGYAFLPLGAVQREKMRCIPYHINSPFAFKEVQLARAHRIILKWSSILAFPQFLLTLSAEVENINIVRDL